MDKPDGYIKVTVEAEFADIPHMRSMPLDGYLGYISNDLFWVDHHGIFRDVQSEYPIATTREQLAALIRYLKEEVEPRMEE